MSGFWLLDYACLALVLVAAWLALTLRNLSSAVMCLSAMGTVLTLLFIVLGAPDVAQAEVVVGAIALPVLYLIAIGKVRTDVEDTGDLGEISQPAPGGQAADRSERAQRSARSERMQRSARSEDSGRARHEDA